MKTVLPGSTIGILGGGQLGRMMALSALEMGYKVIGYTPDHDSPISHVCFKTMVSAYEDLDSLKLFAAETQLVTIEFENVPVESYETVAAITRVAPNVSALKIAQHRRREKTYLHDHGFPVVPFRSVKSLEDLEKALNDLGTPGVLKTASYGYDGKGQHVVNTAAEAREVYERIGKVECILEPFVKFEKEVSVIGARGTYGEVRAYGPIENVHRNGILDLSSVPARINWRVSQEAVEITCAVMESLDITGVMAVEFFVIDGQKLLINEIAPRPHNSGHYSLEACPTSQFEQHIRAITGLPLGKTDPHAAAAMANLLGDLWNTGAPEWTYTLEIPDVHLHLYGKAEARPGRKMGHLTALSRWTEEAEEAVLKARDRLTAARIG